MTQEMEKTLISALDYLEEGVAPATILARYPDKAEELRPYLLTASQLPRLAAQPTIAAQQSSQAAFLSAAAAMRNSSPQAAAVPIWYTLRRLLLPVASLAVILILLGFTIVSFAASALPGDGLYPLKRGVEEFRLVLTVDSEQSANLSQQFQQERLREVAELLRAKRTADVLFEGNLESMAPTEWVIAGLAVQISDESQIEGVPRLGELARVAGRTAAGRLTARQITMLTGPSTPEEKPQPALVPTVAAATPQTNETAEDSVNPAATPAPPASAGVEGGKVVVPYSTATPPAAVQSPAAGSTIVDYAGDGDTSAATEDGYGDGDSAAGEEDEHSGAPGDSRGDDNDQADDANEQDGDSSADDAGGSDEENDDGGSDEGNNSGDDAGGDDDQNDNGGDNGGDEDGNDDSDDGGSDNDDENDNDDDAGGDDDENDNGDDGGNDNDDNDDNGDDSGDDDNDDNGDDGGDDDNDDKNDNGDDSGDDDNDDKNDNGDDGGDDKEKDNGGENDDEEDDPTAD